MIAWWGLLITMCLFFYYVWLFVVCGSLFTCVLIEFVLVLVTDCYLVLHFVASRFYEVVWLVFSFVVY